MVFKIMKIVGFLAAVVIAGYLLLNFSYFSAQVKFFFDRTFVTEQQREFNRNEYSITLESNELYIPTLEIRAPIVFVEGETEAVFQTALQKGVVQYPNTAKVGNVGNTYIFGHSSDFAFAKGDYKTVFALLPNIELGVEIWVSDEKAKVYKYRVYDKFVAEKTATHLLSQETNGKRILTLQTSYPIGTALRRYIVKAELKPE